MVCVARSVIADPEWPNKCMDDQTSEIRACIGDLEGCFLRSCYGQPVGCTVNPDIGFEHEGPLTPGARWRSSRLAPRTARAVPKCISSAFLRAGPMPGTSSSGLEIGRAHV